MAVRIHPESAPQADAALGYLLVAQISLLALALLLGADAVGLAWAEARPLLLLHLLAVGVGVTTLLGVGRHLAVTALYLSPPRLRARAGAPLLQAAAVLALALGFGQGAFALILLGGLLLAASLGLVAWDVFPALRRRRQLGAVHAFLGLAGASLLAQAALGSVLAVHRLAGAPAPDPLLPVHLLLGLGGVFVPAVFGASGQILPMFSAARPHSASWLWGLFALTALGLLACLLLLLHHDDRAAVLASWPPVVAWSAGNVHTLVTGRAKVCDPFFVLGRTGEAALLATLGVLTAGGPVETAAVLALPGFLLASLLAYLCRILPFLFWLALTERHGFHRRIPKLEHYLPRAPGTAAAALFLVGLASWSLGTGPLPALAAPGMALTALALLAFLGIFARGWVLFLRLSGSLAG